LRRRSPQYCWKEPAIPLRCPATQRFIISTGEQDADSFVERKGNEAKDEAKKQPVKENNIIRSQALASRNKLTQLQLKRIVATISNWAGSSCDWKREAG